MSALIVLTICATAASGLLAGISLDTTAVKLPARHRIGARAYAVYARGADLGNGIVVYAAFGVGAAALTVASAVIALAVSVAGPAILPLVVAALLSLAHSFTTARAAPLMLSLKDAPDDEALLAERLNRFTRWSTARAVLQIATFLLLLWALRGLQ